MPYNFQEISSVTVSEDDIKFFEDQAERRGMLKSFVILLAGASTAVQLLSTSIRNGRDLGEYLVARGVDIATPNWGDAASDIAVINLSIAIQDTQLHLEGIYSYSVNGRRLQKPTGKAKRFFRNLVDYYSDVISTL